MLERAAPPFEVPAGLEQRVLPQRRRRRLPRLAWLALPAAAAAAAAAIVLLVGRPAAQRLALRSTTASRSTSPPRSA